MSEKAYLDLSLNINCPGCDRLLTASRLGGYRCYCESCVDAMPPLPYDGRGYNIKGKYPNFKWVSYEPI